MVSDIYLPVIQKNSILCYKTNITYYNMHMTIDTAAVNILVYFTGPLDLLLEYFILSRPHPRIFCCSVKTMIVFPSPFFKTPLNS